MKTNTSCIISRSLGLRFLIMLTFMRDSILERPELTRFIHSVNIQVHEIEVIGILGPGLRLGYDLYLQTIILIKVEVSDYITSFWLPVMIV